MSKSIMIQGTSSGAGKTILSMALCRIFSQDGYKTAPFKSQNMTTNTACIGKEGEIAISQILQAKAANAKPCANMNPVVLKYSAEKMDTQIILNGKTFDCFDANNYEKIKQEIMSEIMKAYAHLEEEYDVIVIEGAGSPVELNLNKDNNDIVNMGIAKQTDSPVLLVADADRGGVFASVYGTVKLLDEEERKYIKASIINRFKGDISHFHDGVEIMERITGIPVAGVVPFIEFRLPEEDDLFMNNMSFASDMNYDDQFDYIADTVRKALDMDLIYQILGM